MTKRERNTLRKLRAIPVGQRTREQIRTLLTLASKDSQERDIHSPIRPQPKKR